MKITLDVNSNFARKATLAALITLFGFSAAQAIPFVSDVTVLADGNQVEADQVSQYVYPGNDKQSKPNQGSPSAIDLLTGAPAAFSGESWYDPQPIFGNLGSWTQIATDGAFTFPSESTSGTWELDPAYIGGNQFVIALKASSGFSLYLFEDLTGPISEGTFDTQTFKNKNGTTQALSHMTLYASSTPATAAVVPEPSTLVMFGSALCMLGWIGFRSRNKKS